MLFRSGDSLASIQYSDLEGQPRLVTLGNTNKNQPTLQTENVQIASTSSTTAQNQQIQVAQNSIWARLFK